MATLYGAATMCQATFACFMHVLETRLRCLYPHILDAESIAVADALTGTFAEHERISTLAGNQYNQWNQNIIEEFRANGGTVTSAPFGRSLVLVHHVGAKSGQERITPLLHIRHDEDTWLITASKGGAPDNPAWYHNLLAHPDTTIETPDDAVVPVHVVELRGEERDTAWARFKEMSPGFRSYEEKTTRTIPVLALHRRAA